jgi:hypothetical protein
MGLQQWFGRQNFAVKSLLGIGFLWIVIATVKGTIVIVKEVLKIVAAAQPPPGSPVIVSGGSLYGTTNSGGWYHASNCDTSAPADSNIYCAPLPNGDSNAFASGGFNSLITKSDSQSWTIQFTDTTDGTHENPNEGILLCSNAKCDPKQTNPINFQYVYIKPFNEQDSEWLPFVNVPGSKLYFHDQSSAYCKPSSKHGGPCDVLAGAWVSVGNSSSVHYTCTAGSKNCWVVVGTPEKPQE